mgnify:FL=1
MKANSYCLGIESTAHTFGASIVSSDGTVLSDVREVYAPEVGKGIHPREAAQHHSQVAPEVLQRAFREARVKPNHLSSIAFSAGPGLGPALRTGATIARALAVFLRKPIVPVHHAIGHIEIGALTAGARDPLVVLVSGGHTAITACADRKWRIFGETEDITLGNVVDSFAREAKLPSPGGSAVEKLALEGKKFIDLPYTVKGNDVAYSGLLTAALKKMRDHNLEDLCYSLQEIAFSMLTEAVERSLAHTEKKEVLLTGGVAANKRLQSALEVITEEHGAIFYVVDPKYSGDCGAQIAWAGLLAFKCGLNVKVEDTIVRPKWRLDEVEIPWRP